MKSYVIKFAKQQCCKIFTILRTDYTLTLCLFALIATLASVRTGIILHSDMLYPIDMLERFGHYGISELNNFLFMVYPILTYYLLYFLSSFLGTAYLDRIWFIGIMEITLLTCGSLWLLYSLRPQVKKSTVALLFICIAAHIYVSLRAYTWMYTWSNGAHHGTFIMSFFVFALVIKYAKTLNFAYLFAIFSLITLSVMSTAIFTAYVALPLLVVCILAVIISQINPCFFYARRYIFYVTLATILGIICGKYIETLTPNRWINATTDTTTVVQIFHFLISSLVSIPQFINKGNFIFIIILVASVLALSGHYICALRTSSNNKSQDETPIPSIGLYDSPFFLAFCMITLIACVVSFIAPILTVGSLYALGSTNNLKYFTQPAIFLVFAGIVAWDGFHFSDKVVRIFLSICAVFFICTGMYAFIDNPRPEQNANVHWDGQETVHYAANWINNLKKQGTPLRDGLATYWESRAVEKFLHDKSRIFPIQNNFNPAAFANSIRLENKNGTAFFNYILINKEQKFHQFITNKAALSNLPAYETLTSPNGKFEILFFKDNTLDRAFKSIYTQFVKNLRTKNH